MAATYAFFADIIEADLLDGIGTDARKLAAVRALNTAARDGRAQAARLIRADVNLPAAYVGPGERRLYVSKQATRNDLEAKITARGRVTSLARFVRGNPTPNAAGVYVEVQPHKIIHLKRAFVIRLPQGNNSVTDTAHNLGLAVRLKPGQVLKNKTTARRVASGLYVLYGPSVSQVFRANDDSGVANDMAPSVADHLVDEFMRLLKV